MAIAIILKTNDNIELLRFTETKLFFDAKNKEIDLFNDCFVIDDANQVSNYLNKDNLVILLKPGYFLTTTFRERIKNETGLYVVKDNDPDVIYFDEDTRININKRSKYKSPSKQNYIIENVLLTVINSKKLIYYDNTEVYEYKNYNGIQNLYGLASGWKTIRFARDIGLENLKNITVYDYNPAQLKFAQYLHSNQYLPKDISRVKNSVGEYCVPEDLVNFWKHWHNYPVNFVELDLFSTPKFLDNSLVWISNVFCYEPTIFTNGWQEVKNKKNRLINENSSCIIIES